VGFTLGAGPKATYVFITTSTLFSTMPQKLLQHKHCIACGKAVLVTEEYCSEECERSHVELLGKKKRQILFLWLGAAAVLILAVVLSLG
jgi:predicted nucleic acid-binding Zn ribbon protein